MVDVLVFGRCGVDIYPLQVGLGLEDVETFGKFLGGSAANVAVAAARLGLTTALVSATGDDPFGRYVKRELARLGVDNRYVGTVADLPTPVTFCEMFPPDRFPIWFYRRPSAPDLQVRAVPDAVAAARIYWSTLTGLCEEPSRTAHFDAWTRRAAAPGPEHRRTVLDLDYRPMFWASPDAAAAQARRAVAAVDVVVGNQQECAVAVGEADPDRAADALLDLGVELAVVKLGADGVLARTRTESVVVPGFAIDVVNGLGAGYAFGGALCAGLLTGLPLEQTVRRANAAGAIVAGRLECSTAMPTADEITALAAQ